MTTPVRRIATSILFILCLQSVFFAPAAARTASLVDLAGPVASHAAGEQQTRRLPPAFPWNQEQPPWVKSLTRVGWVVTGVGLIITIVHLIVRKRRGRANDEQDEP
ncbi:MAG: hypothetical protein H6807_01240 [Planctomycetes bacterium]|nr:hypothetical protein [Planctomycetota bacterium]